MQNRAILRNALRKRNYELPGVSNDMQSSETLRNSLGLNYKSAALNQLSYAGVSIRKVFSEIGQGFVWSKRRLLQEVVNRRAVATAPAGLRCYVEASLHVLNHDRARSPVSAACSTKAGQSRIPVKSLASPR